jgi:hypothetical protein
MHLAIAPKLHTLFIADANVTDAGVAAFQAAMPLCRVNR